MESAYIFGLSGNLTGCLGSGWSEEDLYAWAVGYESRLTLPLPGNNKPYRLRFTVHGLVSPGVKDAQRLVFLCGSHVLGRFDVIGRDTIELALPVALTAGADRITLTLVHPDAVQPATFLDSGDTRRLAICFHSAGLIQEDDSAASGDTAASGSPVPTGIIAGGYAAMQLTRIVRGLRTLEGRLQVHYVDTHPDLADTAPSRPADALSSASFCWLQRGSGRDSTTDALRSALPAACPVRQFGIPEMRVLWPFLGPDQRAVEEPSLYSPSRYRFGDRIAAGMAHYMMADDLIFMIYEGLTEKEMPDLDALLAADIQSWEQCDAGCDVALAPYMREAIGSERLFLAPTVPGGALLHALAKRLLAWPVVMDSLDQTQLLADLDAVMEGYVGPREELPVHPLIARHFKLAWWNPNQIYRWHGNRMTHKDYILDYIKWAPWRP